MKLRQKQEDFVVEEINRFDIVKDGKYKMYLLEKKGMETFSLLSYLSKKNNIPSNKFGIAGLKDKHAFTKQYLTIPSSYDIKTLKENNFSLTFLGNVDVPLKRGRLLGNKFTIVIRSLQKNVKLDVSDLHFPNYFDSQRFGSVIGEKFIYFHVLKKDYENAVKLFLTSYTKSEKKVLKDEKRSILSNWNNLSLASVQKYKSIVNECIHKRWESAYNMIPSHLRQMFALAYRSYQWNECVKELIFKSFDSRNRFDVKYNLGSLTFFRKLDCDLPKNLSKADKSLISKYDLDSDSKKRLVVVHAHEFSKSELEVDELNRGRYKLTLSFSLPKGCYATIVVKRIFQS